MSFTYNPGQLNLNPAVQAILERKDKFASAVEGIAKGVSLGTQIKGAMKEHAMESASTSAQQEADAARTLSPDQVRAWGDERTAQMPDNRDIGTDTADYSKIDAKYEALRPKADPSLYYSALQRNLGAAGYGAEAMDAGAKGQAYKLGGFQLGKAQRDDTQGVALEQLGQQAQRVRSGFSAALGSIKDDDDGIVAAAKMAKYLNSEGGIPGMYINPAKAEVVFTRGTDIVDQESLKDRTGAEVRAYLSKNAPSMLNSHFADLRASITGEFQGREEMGLKRTAVRQKDTELADTKSYRDSTIDVARKTPHGEFETAQGNYTFINGIRTRVGSPIPKGDAAGGNANEYNTPRVVGFDNKTNLPVYLLGDTTYTKNAKGERTPHTGQGLDMVEKFAGVGQKASAGAVGKRLEAGEIPLGGAGSAHASTNPATLLNTPPPPTLDSLRGGNFKRVPTTNITKDTRGRVNAGMDDVVANEIARNHLLNLQEQEAEMQAIRRIR